MKLGKDILARYSISPSFVLGHSDVAPDRKLDPGELFDWQRIAEEGLSIWPTTKFGIRNLGKKPKVFVKAEDIVRIQSKLAQFGYGIETTTKYDEQTNFVSMAFQRHFRPSKITAQFDEECEFILDNLLIHLN